MTELTSAEVRALAAAAGLPLDGADLAEVTHRLNELVLHRERHAVERPERRAVAERLLGRAGLLATPRACGPPRARACIATVCRPRMPPWSRGSGRRAASCSGS
jgi:hypothetical protein